MIIQKNEVEQLNLGIEKLIDEFIDQYSHDIPLTWFDDNIKKYFDIDIYETQFPEAGFATYTLNNVSLLVFRVDLDDSIKEKAIQDFLGFRSFMLYNKNTSSSKEYYDTYKQFIRSIKLPETHLLKMKESRYFNHFYSKGEIDEILSKWK